MNHEYKIDCRFFRGDVPCAPHKEHGVVCSDCSHYQQTDGCILIIKLGATGDVIRTTPLLHRLKKEYPTKLIVWLSYSPDVLPQLVDKKMLFSEESIVSLRAMKFDLLINLDKDPHACALATLTNATVKWGFLLVDNKPAPANQNAVHKFITGIFDDANKANEQSYVQEIFEICGWKFSGEEYILDNPPQQRLRIERNGRPVVGLNTGCGDRWISRKWSDEQWIELIYLLNKNGYSPLLLGGAQEHEINLHLASTTGALYRGHFPFSEFVHLVDSCDAVVTTVTMALHVAIALKKQVVLLNNIFNPKEFELYNRGEIIHPVKDCHCYFRGKCVNKDYFCMDSLSAKSVYDAVIRRLSQSQSVSSSVA